MITSKITNQENVRVTFKGNSETSQTPAKSSIFDSFNNDLLIETEPMPNTAQFWIKSSIPFSNIALEILSVPASSAPV